MQLEDYFDFSTIKTEFGPVEQIRIKGHRIGIEFVIGYFNQGMTPNAIVEDIYPSLTIEEVYTTITYYLHNRERINEYIRHGNEIGALYEQEHDRNPPPIVERLKALKEQRKHSQSINAEHMK